MNVELSTGDDSFSAEEEAAWAAMSSDEPAPKPAGADLPADTAAAPAPAPTGEAQAPVEVGDIDLDAEDDGEINKGRLVRHGAFHQARQRYKAEKSARIALEGQLADLREQFARADERSRLAPAAPAAQAPQAPAQPATPPDPNEDIFGAYAHLQAELASLKAGQTQFTEAQKAEQAQRAEAAQRNEVVTSYRSDVQRVMAARPEFADAYEHLFSSRIQELRLLGVGEADAVRAVREEEFGIAQAAIQAGQSPAERLMQIAQIRGFAPKPAAPAAPAAPAEVSAEKNARIAKGQAASLSLSSAGGAPAGELTLEMLASMSEADFAKMERANPARVRALMGG